MNKIFTILKIGMSCSIIIFILQALIYWFFIEKFEEYYKYSPFFIILLKIGIINIIIYLLFSFFIYNFFNYIQGNFLTKSLVLMAFFVIFKTTPVVLNLFFNSHIDLNFILIVMLMNLLSDIISAFIFAGMIMEVIKFN